MHYRTIDGADLDDLDVPEDDELFFVDNEFFYVVFDDGGLGNYYSIAYRSCVEAGNSLPWGDTVSDLLYVVTYY